MSKRDFPACIVGRVVDIDWAPAAGDDADWPRFRVERESNGWLLLRGVSHDGNEHNRERVWVPLASIAGIEVKQ